MSVYNLQAAEMFFIVSSSVSQDEFPPTDEFPAADEFPSVLKWRRKTSGVSVSSSLPDLLGNSTASLSPTDTPLKPEHLLEGNKTPSRRHKVRGFARTMSGSDGRITSFTGLMLVTNNEFNSAVDYYGHRDKWNIHRL